jgi:hypothetical protein
MFGKLLDLLPPAIVRKIGNSSFANLARRHEIETWIVVEKNREPDLRPDCCFYCGLQIGAAERSDCWDWFVCDGWGIDLIETGSEPTEREAIASAKNWVDEFLKDGDIEGCEGN